MGVKGQPRQNYLVDSYDLNGYSGGFRCPCPAPKDTGSTLFGRPIICTFWREDCPVHADFPTFMRIKRQTEENGKT